MESRTESRRVSKKLMAGIAATSAAGMVVTGLLLGSGTSAADPVSLTLNYTCPFPLIGEQPIKVVIQSDMPASVGVGAQTGVFDIKAVATVPETATQGLALVGATSIEGKAVSGAKVDAPGISLPVNVPVAIAKTAVPPSGAFDVVATGQTPSLSFTQPGTAKITVSELNLNLTPRTADGAETGLGTFDSACKLNPGQENTLHTFEITGGAAANAQRTKE